MIQIKQRNILKTLLKDFQAQRQMKEGMYENRICYEPTREQQVKELYTYLGQLKGMGKTLELYNCKICNSTISENNLERHIKRYF